MPIWNFVLQINDFAKNIVNMPWQLNAFNAIKSIPSSLSIKTLTRKWTQIVITTGRRVIPEVLITQEITMLTGGFNQRTSTWALLVYKIVFFRKLIKPKFTINQNNFDFLQKFKKKSVKNQKKIWLINPAWHEHDSEHPTDSNDSCSGRTGLRSGQNHFGKYVWR